MLRRYEQAKELTEVLLKDWLVKYKFKNWNRHSNGIKVTSAEKENRAEEIASMLSDNGEWHSHGRSINIKTLRKILKLKIEDYSNDEDRTKLIRSYNDLVTEYIRKNNIEMFIHSRNFI